MSVFAGLMMPRKKSSNALFPLSRGLLRPSESCPALFALGVERVAQVHTECILGDAHLVCMKVAHGLRRNVRVSLGPFSQSKLCSRYTPPGSPRADVCPVLSEDVCPVLSELLGFEYAEAERGRVICSV